MQMAQELVATLVLLVLAITAEGEGRPTGNMVNCCFLIGWRPNWSIPAPLLALSSCGAQMPLKGGGGAEAVPRSSISAQSGGGDGEPDRKRILYSKPPRVTFWRKLSRWPASSASPKVERFIKNLEGRQHRALPPFRSSFLARESLPWPRLPLPNPDWQAMLSSTGRLLAQSYRSYEFYFRVRNIASSVEAQHVAGSTLEEI